MSTISVVGIDIAKSVFQVCVWMNDGSVAWNKKISRSRLQDNVRQFDPGTLIAMEACSTSHFWGRTFSAMGYPGAGTGTGEKEDENRAHLDICP